MQSSFSRQCGVSAVGLLFALLLGAFLLTVSLKLGPHYFEYFTIKSAMEKLNREPEFAAMGKQTAINQVEKDLYINNVRDVTSSDFGYKRISNGYELSVDYEVREHLFANVEAVLTFAHQVNVIRGE